MLYWAQLQTALEDCGLLQSSYLVRADGRRLKQWGTEDRILTLGEIESDLASFPEDGFSFRCCADAAAHYSFAIIKGYPGNPFRLALFGTTEGEVDYAADHAHTILGHLTHVAPLGMAALGRRLYWIWQNDTDAEFFPKYFGEMPGYPVVLAGPPPLDFEILDISRNPGREVERSDCARRSVAADLWLGPDFWPYAPCTKEDVLAADFFLEVRDTPQYLYLKSWPHPFTRPDGEQGRVQQKLWRLLFHEDCEWPPGSGGISDTPVGGPPELMPSAGDGAPDQGATK